MHAHFVFTLHYERGGGVVFLRMRWLMVWLLLLDEIHPPTTDFKKNKKSNAEMVIRGVFKRDFSIWSTRLLVGLVQCE